MAETSVQSAGSAGSDAAPVVIEVRDLMKVFGTQTVLDGVSLTVRRGETLVVMGGSGCGKSTLLRHLTGALLPTAGSVFVFGQRIDELDEDGLNAMRKRVGVLYQSGALFNSMTIADNVALPLREHTTLDEAIIDIQVTIKLELVGLREHAQKLPAQISGGMKKRVGMTRAVVLNPKIILFDEPTTGLDPIIKRAIHQLIKETHARFGFTAVIVSHEIPEIFDVAQNVAMLYRGKILQHGTPDEINNSDHPAVRQFISGSLDGPIQLV